jgi:hypothetical protein
MDVDGDDEPRESEFGRQRRGTANDKETAASSLSEYHARGLKKTLTCLRPWSGDNEARYRTRRRVLERDPLVVPHYLVNIRVDLRMKD